MTEKKQKRGPRENLTSQQKLFALYYVEGRNGTQAAISAGYAKGGAATQAERLLRNEHIKKIIADRIERVTDKTEIDIARVVQELHRILIADPVEAVDDEGKVKKLHEWPQDLRRAVSGFEVEQKDCKVMCECGELLPATTTTKKIKFWSKTAAADQLLKKLGAYSDPLADATKTLSQIIIAAAEKRKNGEG